MPLTWHSHKGHMVRCPVEFAAATAAQIAEVCNGMGPAGFGFLVPDTMYGLDVSAAGDVHDWIYAHPTTTQATADYTFLENMSAIIESESSWGLLKWLRKRRAKEYYWAVRAAGSNHFGNH